MRNTRTTALTFTWLCACTILACVPSSGQAESKQGSQSDNKQAAGTPETPKPAAPRPGRDRWLIKTASDKDATAIKPSAVKSTVEKLLTLPRPKDFPQDGSNPKYQDKRAGPVENTVYSVEAELTECRLMPDGDFRVTIKGASGETLVLEMPDPDPKFVDPNSPFAYAIKSARERFEEKFHPERQAKPIAAHARITGIGFFGRAYGKQKDVKGNLVQLHPVLDIQWMDAPTKEFEAAAAKKAPAPATPQRP